MLSRADASGFLPLFAPYASAPERRSGFPSDVSIPENAGRITTTTTAPMHGHR